jgi:hypothetical protein
MVEEGKRPDSLYLLVDIATGGLITVTNPGHFTLPVFTSGFAAADYIKVKSLAGGIHRFPSDSWVTYVQRWRDDGIDSFVLDFCPRCGNGLAIPIKEEELTEQQLLSLWAVRMTSRNYQAQKLIRAYLDTSSDNGQATGRKEKRKLLEELRDHVDCGVPYVHWLIAIEAGIDRDEEVRQESIRRLEEFGQYFKGKVVQSDAPEEWARSLAEANLGLLGSFEMLKPELQAAMKMVETQQ